MRKHRLKVFKFSLNSFVNCELNVKYLPSIFHFLIYTVRIGYISPS